MAGIKDIWARFKLRIAAGKYKAVPFSLPQDLMNIRNVMVCLPPGQRELTMIKQLIPDLNSVFGGTEIYLLAAPGSYVYGIFPKKGFRIMTPPPHEISWCGLAGKNYINILRQNSFDLILDLNLEPNRFVQSMLLAFPKAIKVGGCNNLGAPYYNLEIKSRYLRDEKNIYKSIIDTVGRLRKGKPTHTDDNAN